MKLKSIQPKRIALELFFITSCIFTLLLSPIDLFAVDVYVDDGDLHIDITDPAGETVRVHVVEENGQKYVKVNDMWVYDPNGDSVHPHDIKRIIIKGGPGPDFIDLRDVKKDDFTEFHGSEEEYGFGGYTRDITVDAGGGDDTVEGSELNDDVRGGDGDDQINGNDGHDSLYGNKDSDTINGGDGNDHIGGGDGIDECNGDDGDDSVYGDAGNDWLKGGEGNDTIGGGDDGDVCDGGNGNDRINGGDGTDICTGGPGDDEVNGGNGNDRVSGGGGNDTVNQDFGSADIIADSIGVDTLSLVIDSSGVILDLDLLNQWQVVNVNSDSLMFETTFEFIHGSHFDDIFFIDPDTVPRFTDGGDHIIGDTLYFDARGKEVIDDGMHLVVAGYDTVTYMNYEALIITNVGLTVIELTPEEVNLENGGTQQFAATGYDAFNNIIDFTQVWWTDGGDIDSTGLYTATQVGDFIVTVSDTSGSVSDTARVHVNPTGIEKGKGLPAEFILKQNIPNPFNPETTIEFGVKENCRVVLKIYDIRGRELDVLVDKYYSPGYYRVPFNARDLPTGLYLYRIKMGEFQDVKKMAVLK